MDRQRERFRWVTAVFLLLSLTACGGGEDDGNRVYPNYRIDATSTTPLTFHSFAVEQGDDHTVFTSSFGQGMGSYEPVPMYFFYSYLQYTNPLLKSPPTLNDSWSAPGKWSQSGWTHASVVAGVTESIVAGGTLYDNCVKITTTITGDGADRSGTPASDEVNGFVRGSRDVWYAPGVGVVRMAYSHENGFATVGELQSYSLAAPSSSYFPLAVGNQWTYSWTNGYRTSIVTEVYTVAAACDGPQGDCRL